MSRNLLSRIAVAAIAIPIILWICYTGGLWLFGMIALFATVATWELLQGEKISPRSLLYWLSYLAVAGCLTVAVVAVPFDDLTQERFIRLSFVIYLVVGGVVILPYFLLSGMILAMGKDQPAELFRRHSRLLWGVTYIGALYPIVYLIGNDYTLGSHVEPARNGDLLLLLFGILWVGDTAAMGIGKLLGKHKLAPAVSPNKTVEGLIGGFVGAIAVSLIVWYWKFPFIPVYHFILLGFLCSLFGQLGDLVESMWKRSLGLKDSSGIIPGHGGVLDRFDSLLFAAPVLYYYSQLFVR
ncbi:MAG: phosphatidate cytidylyltransferase [candidate division Zixibacteria bacterium]|nr:phosphatidate cytidylyltransferase [candidate division Zixibacteria bacterium]